jgi:hypothetical protein
MGAIVGMITGSSSSSPSTGSNPDQGELAAQQAQFNQDFALQTQQATIDNENQTANAIASSHAQAASASQAAEREVGDSNAHIVA